MPRFAFRIILVLSMLVGSAAVAMVVFRDQVKDVLFADEFDDY